MIDTISKQKLIEWLQDEIQFWSEGQKDDFSNGYVRGLVKALSRTQSGQFDIKESE